MSIVLDRFFEKQHSRPLSVVTMIGALFCPASLIIFIERPALFFRLPLPTVMLIAVSLSLPIIVLCFGIFYLPLALVHLRRQHGSNPVSVVDTITRDDPMEWPCLLMGSWWAMVCMFGLVVVAYYQPIRIGHSFVQLAAALAAFVALEYVAVIAVEIWRSAKDEMAAEAAQRDI